MMRYHGYRQQRGEGAVYAAPRRGHFAGERDYQGYQFSLFAPPAAVLPGRPEAEQLPYTVRAVAPSLRQLMVRTGSRCPECTGPLVNGEGCVACPVCGFRRQGW